MSTPERPARAPRQATVAYLWVSLCTWTCAPWPLRLTLMGAPAIAHRARLSMPPSSPPPSRYHPLPAGCVCAAAGFLAPMPDSAARAGCARARAAGVRQPPTRAPTARLRWRRPSYARLVTFEVYAQNNLGDDGCETRSTHGHQSQERATANAPAFVL